jgi:hypothetical protein
MIGFSSRAFLALLLSTSAAFAEAPHDIGPAFEQGAEGDAPSIQNDAVAVTPGENTISEAQVSAPAIDGFGTLEQGKGALSEDVWKGSARETAEGLLKALHSGVSGETLQNLVTRLLMTQAPAPQGQGRSSQSWFALRVNALIGIGKDEKAEEMIASLPASMTDASLLQIGAELKLARGQYDRVCEKLQPDALPADNSGEAFWRKLSILCKAQAGKQDEAMVGIDMLHEEQHTDDLFFQEAIRKIGDREAVIKSNPKQWSVLNVTLLRLAEATGKLQEHMDDLPPVVVKYLAQDSKLDIKLRERASARAQQLGIVPGGESRTQEQPFSRPLASDVSTLVSALGSGKPVNDSDNAVIARLALGDAGFGDSRRIQRLLTLMEPFGYQVPPEVWDKLFVHRERYDGELPPASLVSRMTDAANAGRRGEVIILAALVAGGGDLEHASDLVLLPVVKALMAAGFEKEARDLVYAAVKSYAR